MAARKTEAPKPEYDFDNWDEEAEKAALADLVPDVKHIIVERRFVGRFTDGDIVEIPLTLSLEQVDEIEQKNESTVDQFRGLLRTFGGDDAVAKFNRHDLSETVILAQKFFNALQKVQMAAFPES